MKVPRFATASVVAVVQRAVEIEVMVIVIISNIPDDVKSRLHFDPESRDGE